MGSEPCGRAIIRPIEAPSNQRQDDELCRFRATAGAFRWGLNLGEGRGAESERGVARSSSAMLNGDAQFLNNTKQNSRRNTVVKRFVGRLP